MSLLKTRRVYYLHTAHDRVTAQTTGQAPVGLTLTPAEFVERIATPSYVYVLGDVANLPLMAALSRRLSAPGGLSVFLGRPCTVDWASAARQGPLASVALMARADQGPARHRASQGGWRSWGPADDVLCAIWDAESPVARAAACQDHPAAPAWRFLELDLDAVGQLLTRIGDPRWYLSRTDPTRVGPYYAWLGLSPRRALRGSDTTTRETLQRVWDRSPYFQRMYTEQRTAQQPAERAALRVHRRVARYLRDTWLDAVSRSTRPGNSEPIFDPGLYFADRPAVAAEYAEAMRG